MTVLHVSGGLRNREVYMLWNLYGSFLFSTWIYLLLNDERTLLQSLRSCFLTNLIDCLHCGM